MPDRHHATWTTPNPYAVRPCMGDHYERMPSVYAGYQDNFKPGEGFANEEYSRFNSNTENPYVGETASEFYGDFHQLRRSIYTNGRYRVGQ